MSEPNPTGPVTLPYSPAQLCELLRYAIPAHEPVMITGRPGIGKSDLVESVCGPLGLDVDLMISHPVTADATDYKGLPWLKDGTAQWLPYGDLTKIIEAKRPLVCFFDDIGQAAQSVQSALMQLILARRVGEHMVSPHVSFVAATNRKEDSAGVSGIIEPLKSRFNIAHLEPTLEDWSRWALDSGQPVTMVGYVRSNPQTILDWKPSKDLTNSPSPRTMAAAGRRLKANLPEPILLRAIAGDIGPGRAAELIAYHKSVADLPSLDEILTNPGTAKVPSRPDQLFMVTGGLARRVTANNIPNALAYVDRLPADFRAVWITEARHANALAIQKDPSVGNINHTQAFIRWEVAHHELFK